MEPRPGTALDCPRYVGGCAERNSDVASAGQNAARWVPFLRDEPAGPLPHGRIHREPQRRRELSGACLSPDLRGSLDRAKLAPASYLRNRSALPLCARGMDRDIHFDRCARRGPPCVFRAIRVDAPETCVSRGILCFSCSAIRRGGSILAAV